MTKKRSVKRLQAAFISALQSVGQTLSRHGASDELTEDITQDLLFAFQTHRAIEEGSATPEQMILAGLQPRPAVVRAVAQIQEAEVSR
jgi:hypothetical protein